MKVDYHKIKEVISNAIIWEKREEIVGELLIKKQLNLAEFGDLEKLDRQLKMDTDQLAFNILRELKKFLGNELLIFEEGDEVTFNE